MSVADNSDFVSLMPESNGWPSDDWLDSEISQERLLLQNERFLNDIKTIREKYGINVIAQGDYSDYGYMDFMNNPPELMKNPDFKQDVQYVINKVKLPGKWLETISHYIFGLDNIGFGNFEYKKNALGRVVESKESDYVEIRLYGDLTVPELRKIVSSRGVRKLINQSLPTKKPYKTDDKDGYIVHRLRKSGMTYEAIWNQLKKDGRKYEDYNHVHKLHSRFKAKVDKLYA